jgi:multidrug efflux system membrane fusion protein
MSARHLAFAALSCSLVALIGGAAPPAAGPPEVTIARPVVKEVTDYEDLTGRIEAVATVQLRARVSGYLTRVAFEVGDSVKKGDVLCEIDARPLRAAADEAAAGVAQAEANLRLAELEHRRAQKRVADAVAARAELERAAAVRDQARAALALARARLDAARLILSFTRVVAPIDGRVTRRPVDPGNLVKADDTVLGTIVSLAPVHAVFDVDELTFLRLWRANKGKKTPVLLGLAGEDGFPRRGEAIQTDSRIDAKTGAVHMRATFANKDEALRPGQFVRVRLLVGAPHRALLVPEKALLSAEGRKFLLVVGAGNVLERRAVVVGLSFDGSREIREGLRAEERVVIGGLARLRPGAIVSPRIAE